MFSPKKNYTYTKVNPQLVNLQDMNPCIYKYYMSVKNWKDLRSKIPTFKDNLEQS